MTPIFARCSGGLLATNFSIANFVLLFQHGLRTFLSISASTHRNTAVDIALHVPTQVYKSDILSIVAQYGVSVTESCVARLPINTPGYTSLYLTSPSILSDSLDESVVSNPSCDCY